MTIQPIMKGLFLAITLLFICSISYVKSKPEDWPYLDNWYKLEDESDYCLNRGTYDTKYIKGIRDCYLCIKDSTCLVWHKYPLS